MITWIFSSLHITVENINSQVIYYTSIWFISPATYERNICLKEEMYYFYYSVMSPINFKSLTNMWVLVTEHFYLVSITPYNSTVSTQIQLLLLNKDVVQTLNKSQKLTYFPTPLCSWGLGSESLLWSEQWYFFFFSFKENQPNCNSVHNV